MTRDDLKLKLGVVLAVLGAIATLSDGMLPPALLPYLPWFRLASIVVGVVSAQLGTSPLPGKPPEPVSDGTLARINGDRT